MRDYDWKPERFYSDVQFTLALRTLINYKILAKGGIASGKEIEKKIDFFSL